MLVHTHHLTHRQREPARQATWAYQLRNYRDFLAYPDQWGNAHWLYQHNGGVFLPPWGKCELGPSPCSTLADVQHFVSNLDRMAADLRSDR